MNEATQIWDVAVIGAGPAGAMAALAAASANSRVILLDRAKIPRYKTCGGGLISASMRMLPEGMTLPGRTQINAFTFTIDGRHGRTRTSKEPLLNLVMRDEFDAALVDCAKARGVVVSDRTTVVQIAETADLVKLSTRERGDIHARVVVGADGSAGRSSSYVGVVWRQVDLGLEVEVPTPPEQAETWTGRILIDLGHIPGAYGWVFPKGETLSVGVIGARGDGDTTRAYMTEFMSRLNLSHVEPRISSGHLTRCRAQGSPLSRGRVMVAGDAAGLLEPWTREGISFALRSGLLAGQSAAVASKAATAAGVAGAMVEYTDGITSTLEPEMMAGQAFLEAFARRPRAFYLAAAFAPQAWRLVVNLVSGQTTFAAVQRQWPARLALALLRFRVRQRC